MRLIKGFERPARWELWLKLASAIEDYVCVKISFCLFSQASGDMEEIFQFIENLNKRLARGIKDLDDVRSSMAALSEIRESEIRFVFNFAYKRT